MTPSDKTRVKRVPKRGIYDAETIYSILDKEFVCHVGFVHEGYPVVIPTLFGRQDNKIFIHGATSSRMLTGLNKGIECCVTVTRVNGVVLARSAFHHSANYESVVLFGKATVVPDAAKEAALKAVSDHILKGRWEDCRQPIDKELKATMVLEIAIDEASAKIRTGGPVDDKPDYDLDYWAGVLPIHHIYGEPLRDEVLKEGIPLPDYLEPYAKR